jgi:hypothetical protein
MDAAVAVDAQNAPTATWKTAQDAVSHSAHTHHLLVGKGRRNKNGHRFTHKIPDSPNTNRIGAIAGLYLRLRTSREAAFGGPIERPLCFVLLVSFVV